MNKLFLLLLLPLLGSCSGCCTKTVSDNAVAKAVEVEECYFDGEFQYYADAATFTDCVTGTKFTVRMSGDYKTAESQYRELNGNIPICCELYGKIVDKPADEEGYAKQLEITKFVGFNAGETCNPEAILVGTYNSVNKSILQLNADYTYDLDNVKGTWGRVDMDNLFLNNGTTTIKGEIDFVKKEIKISNEVYSL